MVALLKNLKQIYSGKDKTIVESEGERTEE